MNFMPQVIGIYFLEGGFFREWRGECRSGLQKDYYICRVNMIQHTIFQKSWVWYDYCFSLEATRQIKISNFSSARESFLPGKNSLTQIFLQQIPHAQKTTARGEV
jgi:hypothetical protein